MDYIRVINWVIKVTAEYNQPLYMIIADSKRLIIQYAYENL